MYLFLHFVYYLNAISNHENILKTLLTSVNQPQLFNICFLSRLDRRLFCGINWLVIGNKVIICFMRFVPSTSKKQVQKSRNCGTLTGFTTAKRSWRNSLWTLSNKFEKGGSPGLVVMGYDSWSRGRGFESRWHILDVIDIFLNWFVVWWIAP